MTDIKQTNNKMSQRNLYPKQKTAKNYVLKVINQNNLVNNIVQVHCALFSPDFCEYQVCFCRYWWQRVVTRHTWKGGWPVGWN